MRRKWVSIIAVSPGQGSWTRMHSALRIRLNKGMHGNMQYMENHFELRADPTKLVPGAKSVITLLLNYFPGTEQTTENKISKYAYGKDYHEVIRQDCMHFFNWCGKILEK